MDIPVGPPWSRVIQTTDGMSNPRQDIIVDGQEGMSILLLLGSAGHRDESDGSHAGLRYRSVGILFDHD